LFAKETPRQAARTKKKIGLEQLASRPRTGECIVGAGLAGKSGWAALGVEKKERKAGPVYRVSAQPRFGQKRFLFKIFRSFNIYKFV
jgi:hypothetical protein